MLPFIISTYFGVIFFNIKFKYLQKFITITFNLFYNKVKIYAKNRLK